MIKRANIEYIGMAAVSIAILIYTGLVFFLRNEIGLFLSIGLILLGIIALVIWVRGVGSDIRKRTRRSVP